MYVRHSRKKNYSKKTSVLNFLQYFWLSYHQSRNDKTLSDTASSLASGFIGQTYEHGRPDAILRSIWADCNELVHKSALETAGSIPVVVQCLGWVHCTRCKTILRSSDGLICADAGVTATLMT